MRRRHNFEKKNRPQKDLFSALALGGLGKFKGSSVKNGYLKLVQKLDVPCASAGDRIPEREGEVDPPPPPP